MSLPILKENVGFGQFIRIRLVQCKLPVYILGNLPRVAIWNRDC